MCTEKWMICHLSRIKITKLPFMQNCSCLREGQSCAVMKLLVISSVCWPLWEGLECKNRNSIIQLVTYPVRTDGQCQNKEKPGCFANELDQDRQVNAEKYIVPDVISQTTCQMMAERRRPRNLGLQRTHVGLDTSLLPHVNQCRK